MRRKHITQIFGTFVFYLSLLILYPLAIHAEQIQVENWAIEAIAKRADDSLPVYVRPNDTKESGTVIEIPKSPYINGLSSIVLAQYNEGHAYAFVKGELLSPGNHFIVVTIEIRNTEKVEKSLQVGDIEFVTAGGHNLPYAALSKGDSYLVAKTSLIALESSQKLNFTIKPEEKIELTYCFILPPKSTPVVMSFRKAKNSFSIHSDKIPKYETSSSSSLLELAGQFNLPYKTAGQEIDGSFTNLGTDIRFRSDVTVPEGVLAAYTSSSGARSLNTAKVSEKLKGVESTITLSSFYMFQGSAFILGTIIVSKRITPFEINIPLGKDKIHALIKSSFQAEEGDLFAGIGPVKVYDSSKNEWIELATPLYVLSVK
jgi:hypothetical protein